MPAETPPYQLYRECLQFSLHPSIHRSCRRMRATLVMLCSSFHDPYRVLGLPATATRREIRARYLALAKLLHPDADAAPPKPGAFADVASAYEEALRRLDLPREGSAAAAAWRFDDSWPEGDGELLMRLRRDWAGGRAGRPRAPRPSVACVRAFKNAEPPCFVICSACKGLGVD